MSTRLHKRDFNYVYFTIIPRWEKEMEQRQAFAGQNEELDWVLVKCLRKRVGEPGLINACNISRVKSEEKDAGRKGRGHEIMEGGPLFALNVFIDWKRLLLRRETIGLRPKRDCAFKKGLWLNGRSSRPSTDVEISSIDENWGKGRWWRENRRVARSGGGFHEFPAEATEDPELSLRLMRCERSM